jgi:polyisoprenoid-binding protein YceI
MKRTFILSTMILAANLLLAQEEFKLVNSKVDIAGTSTLHDWTAEVTRVSGSGKISFKGKELSGITALSISLDAQSIKSEKGTTMDNNIYKTLKAKQYPAISFNLTKVNSITPKGGGYEVNADGKITIAGVTKTVNLLVNGTENNGGITFKGSKKLKMTDYGLEPPVMFLGTLKTGDEVTVRFEATLSRLKFTQ